MESGPDDAYQRCEVRKGNSRTAGLGIPMLVLIPDSHLVEPKIRRVGKTVLRTDHDAVRRADLWPCRIDAAA